MRERLIELIKLGDKTFADKYTGKVMSHIDELYDFIADYLLENGVIVPPCKVEDVVWDNDFGRPCSYIVTGFDIGKTLDDEENHKGMFMYYENHNGSVQCNCPITQIGETVFLTREEAEQALTCQKSRHVEKGGVSE